MQCPKIMTALALSLAAQTVVKADTRIARLCGHISEVASKDDIRNSPGGHYVARLTSTDDRAMFPTIAVTIHLSNQGKLIRLPHGKPMNSMAECRAWTHQQEFMPVLPGYLATFHYCDCAVEASAP